MAIDGGNAFAGQFPFQCGGIIDEIGLTKADAQNAAAGDGSAQTADNRFDFGEFRHGAIIIGGENLRAASNIYEG